MRGFLGTISYIIAGFLIFTAGLMSSIDFTNTAAKLPYFAKFKFMAIYASIAIPFFATGLFLRGLSRWRADIGIVLMSTAVLMGMCALMMASVFSDPGMRSLMGEQSVYMFSDYPIGLMTMGALFTLGFFCYRRSRSKLSQQT